MKFITKLSNFLKYFISENFVGFHDYFVKQYVQNTKYTRWALFNRIKSRCNVNMFSEAAFVLLKEKFLLSKKNGRLDKCLEAIFEWLDYYYSILKKRSLSELVEYKVIGKRKA